MVTRHLLCTGCTVFSKEPWMAVLLCTGCTDRYMLLQYLHFHHPWWSYTARSHGWRCCYVRDVRTDICSSATARPGFLSRSTTYIHVVSCVALICYIHLTMQYLHFYHPWWAYTARRDRWRCGYAVFLFSASLSNETWFQPYFIKVRIFAWSFPSGLLSTSSR